MGELDAVLEVMHVSDSPFFFLPPSALVALPLPRVTFSLGMMLMFGSGYRWVVSGWLRNRGGC
jgi:hypothetical protein